MRRLLVLISAAAVTSCTGLYLENGNAYPCDFSLPAGERDLPCLPGDVCGSGNLCIKYIYEGPRFEGTAVQPDYALTAARVIHPVTLTTPVTKLARDNARRAGVLVQQTVGPAVRVNEKGQFVAGQTLPADFQQPAMASLTLPVGSLAGVVGLTADRLSYSLRSPTGMSVSNTNGSFARRVRVTAADVGLRLQAVGLDGTAADVALSAPPMPALTLQTPYAVDGGALDVALLNRQGLPPARPTAVVLATTGLWLEQLDGGFEPVITNAPRPDDGTLHINFASTVLAATQRNVLSTWQVGVSSGEPRTHTLQQAWADCSPCAPGQEVEAVTPLPPTEGLGVDVLCRGLRGRTLVRVTGSNAVEPTDLCEVEARPFPFDLTRVAAVAPVAAATQRGFAVGGKLGEVWSGETLSSLLPLTLERVPLDVTTVKVRVGPESSTTLSALTDRYLAALQPRAPADQLLAGFRRVDVSSDFGSAEDVHFIAAVHGLDGWAVTSTGVLARVKLDEGAFDRDAGPLLFGPRLVTPAGEPVRRSVGGEVFVLGDGGVPALFVTADDGLYMVSNPEDTLGDLSQGTSELTPQLQPEPSVPIRSLALERTPLGTDGVSRARGYLVTSRNVYEWKLSGSPARWSSTPLVLAGGEPLEVWFDHSKSALGRVGYADGQIYTLPGGYQLALPLPGAADDVPAKVLDYENFGGWPVALTTTGLYAAGWDVVDGRIQNRFADGGVNRPMTWRKLQLPDGGVPWEDGEQTRGKLFVQQDPPDAGLRRFRLFLFLPEQVLELGQYDRK